MWTPSFNYILLKGYFKASIVSKKEFYIPSVYDCLQK